MMTVAAPRAWDAEWDAGDLGCGELILALKLRMRPLCSGQMLRLKAADPGAVEDIPAWCRLTGHTLVHLDADARLYFIRHL